MRVFLIYLFVFLIFYAYFGYGLLLYSLGKFLKRRSGSLNDFIEYPKISVIIAARNEEKRIKEKIENTLNLNYQGEYEIIVASDASDDDTNKICQKYEAQGVLLSVLEKRGGKEASQKKALEISSGNIVVFTDASVKLAEDSLEKFANYFKDLRIGAVSSKDKVITESDAGEGLYVSYEMKLRELESRINTVIGLSGSCFAVRKDIACQMLDNIPSDFSLLIKTIENGLRGVHGDDVIHFYSSLINPKDEFYRKVRTVLRGMTALFSSAYILNPFKYGLFSFQVLSHKVLRWLVPWFAIFAFLLSSFGDLYNPYILIVFISYCFFILTVTIGYIVPNCRKYPLVKIFTFLLISNSAILNAWYYFLTGKKQVSWKPTER